MVRLKSESDGERSLVLWACRDQSTLFLDDTIQVRVGERDGKSHALPFFLCSFPLETNYRKLHTFEVIISLLSPANLELRERLEGEVQLREILVGLEPLSFMTSR